MPAGYSTIPQSTDPLFLVPSGGIMMWHGLIANIPAGWVICDGNNGTPDLEDRFVVGAPAATEAGGLTGETTHIHPAHANHVFTQPGNHASLADHAHDQTVYTGSSFLDKGSTQLFGAGTSVNMFNQYSRTSTTSNSRSPDLTKAVSAGTPNAHSGGGVDAHSAHDSPNSRPPFFVILFIMKS